MLRDETDYDNFFEDTLKAGHFENDKKSVEIMIRGARAVVDDLLKYGAEFHRDEKGEVDFTREGAHSAKRIIYHEDTTGKEITSTLLKEVRNRRNIEILEHTTLLDIIERDNVCYGAVVQRSDGSVEVVEADYVVLATGGIGGLYKHSTNFSHLTGDALAIAIKHGVELKDVSYVQIHPTTFYSREERSFLISESVRGEGAVLRDKNGNRFTNELLPRDLLSQEIWKQMEKDQTEFVWEDLSTIPESEREIHFPSIIDHCKKMGYDVSKDWIPVVPAQHYYMGGIKVDHSSRTSMEQLYAIGETACNGVHGRNRLASNSLLESLVFAKRAAQEMTQTQALVKKDSRVFAEVDFEQYRDVDDLQQKYRQLVWKEIQKDSKDNADNKY
jgi:L-aspartate oxidase